MKRKGPKSIPDFSSKRGPSPKPGVPADKPVAAQVPRAPAVKPQATSSKGGRRGQ